MSTTLVELAEGGIATKGSRTLARSLAALQPYQQRWCRDRSRIKVHEASRRIGKTEAEAVDAALTRSSGEVTRDYWFSSADESAAREFMERLRHYCGAFGRAVELLTGEEVIDTRRFTVFTIPFDCGERPCKAVAMASNPKGFRSKGGDVRLDEFAHHEQPREMWKAAYPVISLGGSIGIMSSHRGELSFFNELVMMGKRRREPEKYGAPKPTDFPVSLHTNTIYGAVAEGLVERINRCEGASYTREAYLAELRAGCDQVTWEEEYECKPSSEAGSFFPFDLLRPLVHADASLPTDDLSVFVARVTAASEEADTLFAGCDLGRVKDRFVLWVWAKVGGVLRTVGVLRFTGRDFATMEAATSVLMRLTIRPKKRPQHTVTVRRCCVDATGMGMQFAERMKEKFATRIEPVVFTAGVKEELATLGRRHVEEKTITLPDDPQALAEWNGIRRTVTAAGNTRFDGERGGDGHCDQFWAGALGLHAAARAKSSETRFYAEPRGGF